MDRKKSDKTDATDTTGTADDSDSDDDNTFPKKKKNNENKPAEEETMAPRDPTEVNKPIEIDEADELVQEKENAAKQNISRVFKKPVVKKKEKKKGKEKEPRNYIYYRKDRKRAKRLQKHYKAHKDIKEFTDMFVEKDSKGKPNVKQEILHKNFTPAQISEYNYMRKVCCDILLYTVYVITVSIKAYYISSHQMFLLIDEMNTLMGIGQVPFNDEIYMYLHTVTTPADYWKYLHDKIMPALYEPPNPRTPDSAYFMQDNLILGEVRLRQLRVKPNTCKVDHNFISYFKDCYESYSKEREDRTEFQGIKYQDAKATRSVTFVGKVDTYEGGGYIVSIPHWKEPAKKKNRRT